MHCSVLIGMPIVRQTERSQRLSDSMNLLIPEYYLSRLRTDTVNVLGLHAKIEGLRFGAGCGRFLLKLGARIGRLSGASV